MDYRCFTKRGLLNAEFFLTRLIEGKKGETLAIVADEGTYAEACLLSVCAKKLGLKPFVIDVSVYGISRFTEVDYSVLEPVKAAIRASDICVSICLGFARLLGGSREMDSILTGDARCFGLRVWGISEWDFDFDESMAARERAPKLKDLVMKSSVLNVKNAAGTDLTCKVGSGNIAAIYEVLAIAPFFAEVAIIPNYDAVNGIVAADGAVSQGIRKNQFGSRELGLEPIRLTIKDGIVTGYTADPLQKKRLEDFIRCADPVAGKVDEIGLVTTTAGINDEYQWFMWSNGTHHSKSMHIALGNNEKGRSEMVHAPAHADFDIMDPTIELDGKVILKGGIFNDAIIFK